MIEYLSELNEKWWLERLVSVVLDLFEAFWGEFNFLQFQQISWSWKFRWISRSFRKFWNWRQRNFIFRGFYMVEYLSNLHEKLIVRKVKSCTLRHVFQSFLAASQFWFDLPRVCVTLSVLYREPTASFWESGLEFSWSFCLLRFLNFCNLSTTFSTPLSFRTTWS